jgi:hypothetical protein
MLEENIVDRLTKKRCSCGGVIAEKLERYIPVEPKSGRIKFGMNLNRPNNYTRFKYRSNGYYCVKCKVEYKFERTAEKSIPELFLKLESVPYRMKQSYTPGEPAIKFANPILREAQERSQNELHLEKGEIVYEAFENYLYKEHFGGDPDFIFVNRLPGMSAADAGSVRLHKETMLEPIEQISIVTAESGPPA